MLGKYSLSENLKGRDHFKDLCTDGKMALKDNHQ
jgi:hypothetical protein